METPLLEVTLARKGGGNLSLKLGKEGYSLKVSSRPKHSRLAGYIARSLFEAVTLDQLLTTNSSELNKSNGIPQTEYYEFI